MAQFFCQVANIKNFSISCAGTSKETFEGMLDYTIPTPCLSSISALNLHSANSFFAACLPFVRTGPHEFHTLGEFPCAVLPSQPVPDLRNL